MILVSGTGRCGSSLWMQILHAAGVPVVGERFSRDWEQQLSGANPRGFYESNLREGINFSSNPDPRSGAWLDPELHHHTAVKVFIAGVRRSERRYIDRVLLLVRGWRDFRASALRMRELEASTLPPGVTLTPVQEPAARWFREHVALLGDLLQRDYPLRVVTFEDTLSRPEQVIPAALSWLQVDCDPTAALGAVDPSLPSPPSHHVPEALNAWVPTLDGLHGLLTEQRPLSLATLDALVEQARLLDQAFPPPPPAWG